MSLSIEQMIEKQITTNGRIDRIITNLRKQGPSSKLTKGDLQTRIETLDCYWSKFEEIHDTLWKYKEKLKDSEYYKNNIYEETEELYITRKGELRQLFFELDKNTAANQDGGNSENQSAHRQNNRLPKLPLPKFDGSYDNWPSFQDLFKSMLEKNPELSGVDKLQYLKMSVRGGPAEIFIKELSITNDNYERAWNTLLSHYQNKRIIIRTCLEKFFSLPRMKFESATELDRIVKGLTSTLNSLEGLGRPMISSEDFIVHFLINLLDDRTHGKWEDEMSKTTEPSSLSTLSDFLGRRLLALQASQSKPATKQSAKEEKKSVFSNRSSRSYHVRKGEAIKQRDPHSCPVCSKPHLLMFCEQYKQKPGSERKQTVESNNLCLNCLGTHKISACYSKKRCFKCDEKHHTTLHDAFRELDQPVEKAKAAHHIYDCRNRDQDVMLATARTLVEDRFGHQHPVRVLIDQGSQVSMITERLVQRLRLPRKRETTNLYGVGGPLNASARAWVSLALWPMKTDDKILVRALILSKLSCYRIEAPDPSNWPHLQGIELADPDPSSAAPIDVLLGADVFAAIIRDGLRRGDHKQPIAQCTIFGWILSGFINETSNKGVVRSHEVTIGDQLLTTVHRFWEQEELPVAKQTLTTAEQQCERHYQESHARNREGRYIVRLPFAKPPADFRQSKTAAFGALVRMEKKFHCDQQLKQLYTEFMNVYEDLYHMTLVPRALAAQNYFILPHRGVYRESSSTTKLRVVFNGSWSSSSMPSLNEHLHPGPNLLPNLSDVLLRWRKHQFVLAADIVKMYRQILIHPDDRDFQRILWRTNSDQAPNEYQLNTVTYGLSCAPFLAMRTLKQLAIDEGQNYPMGAAALTHDTYMDDILTGSETMEDLRKVKQQLIDLCRAGGFPLQKWASNDTAILDDTSNRDAFHVDVKSQTNGEIVQSTLGLRWNQHSDVFKYSVAAPSLESTITKRSILSQASKLFDPLGWLAPVIVKAKITIQTSWLLGLDWDDPLPENEAKSWLRFQRELTEIQALEVPRKLSPNLGQRRSLELHGFADASERAYAAVIYLRSQDEDNGAVSVTLVTAKSKVAPVKQVTLPRLELCGAVLLSRLVDHVRSVLLIENVPVRLWTDSTIALGWIKGSSTRWKTYVANRVAEIQRLTSEFEWHHIRSEHNPADLASRGIWPAEVTNCDLWWRGPEFLYRSTVTPFEESYFNLPTDLPEAKEVAHIGTVTTEEENTILKRFSSFSRLLRVTAWCRRWLTPIRNKLRTTNTESFLTAEEIRISEINWIRLEQDVYYKKEKKALLSGGTLAINSKIIKLTPLVDEQQLLRVGGRLNLAELSYDEKHPIILPPLSHLTALIVDSVHRKILHGGVQATLASIRQRFWIPRGRSLVKQRLNRCVVCIRWRASQPTQLMADLPTPRVNYLRPFLHTGLDYAGPMMLRTSPGRGHKASKAFLVIFVCMATRAVHLDVASDYSTEAFLAAFRRFIARRGICSDLYSDNGTNFQGADAELRRLLTAGARDFECIRNELTNLRINWHFNPPAAPHHGGLWEAAVKSTKYHLKRTIGEQKLTFEEMSTLLSQIEACLNSRPLAALSDDPKDLTALTPGHALIGAPLTSLPEPSLLDTSENRLSRWQMLTQMRDQFWQRWSREYLQQFVSRHKWLHQTPNIQVGRLCLISNETTPPARWPLGRIVAVHPGSDLRVRVCTIKTSSTELVRPITRLVLLPLSTENSPSA